LHTGFIVRAADILAGTWPAHNAFPNAEYIEVGWGDSKGYRQHWTTHIVSKALFDSQGSALLIHAFSGPVIKEYKGIAKEIIAVKLSDQGFVRLCNYVQNSYVPDRQGRPILLPSVYSDKDFFQARGHYSMFNNCNNWTARALREAGCSVIPRLCLLPGIVMFETRRFGRVLRLDGQYVKQAGEPIPRPVTFRETFRVETKSFDYGNIKRKNCDLPITGTVIWFVPFTTVGALTMLV
jgi:uncharacterized protein (TIGR02117 family)